MSQFMREQEWLSKIRRFGWIESDHERARVVEPDGKKAGVVETNYTEAGGVEPEGNN